MVKFIYGVIPVPVKWTDAMADNTAGYAKGPFIRLRPRYEHDRGLLEHELGHVWQFWRLVIGGMLAAALFSLLAVGLDEPALFAVAMVAPVAGVVAHSLLYRFVDAYRRWSEVTCYRIQARWYPDDRRPLFAAFIANDYHLDVTEAEALQMLRDA